jgi:hypothetical protein
MHVSLQDVARRDSSGLGAVSSRRGTLQGGQYAGRGDGAISPRAMTTHRRDAPQRARSSPKSLHLVSCGATTTSVAHVPRTANVTAIDAQLDPRLLPAHERSGQRIALTPVRGLGIPVCTPMRSQASDSVGVSGLPAFTPAYLVSTRHRTILAAGLRKGRAVSARNEASLAVWTVGVPTRDSTEGERGQIRRAGTV